MFQLLDFGTVNAKQMLLACWLFSLFLFWLVLSTCISMLMSDRVAFYFALQQCKL